MDPCLKTITHGIERLRAESMAECRRLLLLVPKEGGGFAGKFTNDEMRFLLEVYARVPWSEIRRLDPYDASPESTLEDVGFAFSQVLAGHLNYLYFILADPYFAIPGEDAEDQGDFALNLVDRVLVLPAAEAVALYVVLSSARVIPASVLCYDNWWYPEMMLRLLECPEMDWLFK